MKINKNFAAPKICIIGIVTILLCSTSPGVFAQAKSDINKYYFFSKKPFVHPKIVEDLETWISDEGEQVVAINLAESMGTNRYFGDISVDQSTDTYPTVTYTNTEACEDNPCPMGPPYFSYELIGKTSSGIYVLLTKDSGGGSGVFENLLLVTLENDTGLSYDKEMNVLQLNRKRLIIKRLKEIPLGDRYKGIITLKGNELHINENRGRTKTRTFEKDTIIKIEGGS